MVNKTIEYQNWEIKIKKAEEFMETELNRRWTHTLNQYRNNFQRETKVSDYEVTVNLVRGLSGIVVPAIYFRDPTVRCQPRIPGTEMACRLTEELLNYYLRKLRVKRQIKKVILDALLFGRGYLKLGYEVELERQDLEPIADPETGEAKTNIQGEPLFSDSDGAVFALSNGLVKPFLTPDGSMVSPGDQHPSLYEDISREQPYLLRWSPWDVLVDPDCTDVRLSNAMWVDFRSLVPLEEAKNNPLYADSKASLTKLQGSKLPDYLMDVRNKDLLRGEQDTEWVVLHEIFHKEYNKNTNNWEMKWKHMAEGHDRFLLDDNSPYMIRGFPVEVLCFEEDPESNDPLSPIDVIKPQIHVVNVSRSQYTMHRERYNQKYIYNRASGVTDRDMRNIAEAGINAYVGVKIDPQIPIANVIAPVPVVPMMPEIYNDAEIAFEDIRRIFGINDYHFGGTGVAREPTEASYIEGALTARMNEKQDSVGDLLHESLRKVTQILKQWGDFETAFKITREGQEVWEQFRVADTIPDDLEFFVDIHTASYEDKATERKDMMDLLNITINDPSISKYPIYERLFKTYAFPDPRLLINPQPTMPVGPDGQPLQVQGGQANAVDPAALRQPPNTDAGNQGRAIGA